MSRSPTERSGRSAPTPNLPLAATVSRSQPLTVTEHAPDRAAPDGIVFRFSDTMPPFVDWFEEAMSLASRPLAGFRQSQLQRGSAGAPPCSRLRSQRRPPTVIPAA